MRRKSNIELLRVVSMLMVLMLHANYMTWGRPDMFSIVNNPLPNAIKILGHNFSIVAVNVFVLISGWFGIKITTKRIVSFVFQGLFLTFLLFLFQMGLDVGAEPTVRNFVNGTIYSWLNIWFVPAYLGLMLVSPLINYYFECSSYTHQKKVIVCFFILTVTSWISPNLIPWGFNNGYTTLHLLFIYSLGRYLKTREQKLYQTKPRVYFIMFVVCSFINSLLFVVFMIVEIDRDTSAYTSPLVIGGAVCLFLATVFWNRDWESSVINVIAKSSFSVLIVHLSLFHFFVDGVIWSSNLCTFFLFRVFLILIYLILVFVISELLDFVQQFFFSVLYRFVQILGIEIKLDKFLLND